MLDASQAAMMRRERLPNRIELDIFDAVNIVVWFENRYKERGAATAPGRREAITSAEVHQLLEDGCMIFGTIIVIGPSPSSFRVWYEEPVVESTVVRKKSV